MDARSVLADCCLDGWSYGLKKVVVPRSGLPFCSQYLACRVHVERWGGKYLYPS